MARAKRVVNPGKHAGFQPMQITPGAWWLMLCRLTDTDADAWARRFDQSGNQMYHKLEAEVVRHADRRTIEQGTMPDDIWLALGDLKDAADKITGE